MANALINGWVARDKDYMLHFFFTKPKRYEDLGVWASGGDRYFIPGEISDIQWNDEPKRVTLTIS